MFKTFWKKSDLEESLEELLTEQNYQVQIEKKKKSLKWVNWNGFPFLFGALSLWGFYTVQDVTSKEPNSSFILFVFTFIVLNNSYERRRLENEIRLLLLCQKHKELKEKQQE